MKHNSAAAENLDRHATLLQQHEAASAAALVARSDEGLSELMRLAERVQDTLVPVAPEMQFRNALGERLIEEAKRVRRAGIGSMRRARSLRRAPRALARNSHRILIGGGAAVAVLGVAAALVVRGRDEQAPAQS